MGGQWVARIGMSWQAVDLFRMLLRVHCADWARTGMEHGESCR